MQTNWEKSQEYFRQRQISSFDVPEQLFSLVKDACYYSKENGKPFNDTLAGHIKEEFLLPFNGTSAPQELLNFLYQSLVQGPFGESFSDQIVLSQPVPPFLGSMWVNFQKKHEFNPIHLHTGVASFIIFVKIPYDLQEEEDYFEVVAGGDTKYTSKLSFVTVSHNGYIDSEPVDVDKSFEGKMLFFDAKHRHLVYPFYTSDDYRITVSGNILYDTRGAGGQ